jgi:transcription elongation factor
MDRHIKVNQTIKTGVSAHSIYIDALDLMSYYLAAAEAHASLGNGVHAEVYRGMVDHVQSIINKAAEVQK